MCTPFPTMQIGIGHIGGVGCNMQLNAVCSPCKASFCTSNCVMNVLRIKWHVITWNSSACLWWLEVSLSRRYTRWFNKYSREGGICGHMALGTGAFSTAISSDFILWAFFRKHWADILKWQSRLKPTTKLWSTCKPFKNVYARHFRNALGDNKRYMLFTTLYLCKLEQVYKVPSSLY